MLNERSELEAPPPSSDSEGFDSKRPGDIARENENPLYSRLLELQQTLRESAARQDLSLAKSSVEQLQQFLAYPEATQLVEELVKNKLQMTDKATRPSTELPATPSNEQHQQEKQENRGDMKIIDVVASLKTYKTALERAKAKGQSTKEMFSPGKDADKKISSSQDLLEGDEKNEMMQAALAALKEEPMVATLVCLIGEEPTVLEFFIDTLNSIKATKEKAAEEKEEEARTKGEPTIDIVELFILILMCDLIS